MSLRLLVVFAGLAAALWAFRNWRRAIEASLVLLVFEGAIRKWLFPGAQDLVYFGKDVLLLAAFLGYFQRRPRTAEVVPPALGAALIAASGFGALQIFNPNLPNVLVGLLGFKAYFLYVPLLWVMPAVFPDDRALAAFLRRYIWLSIPVALLALAQFRAPADSSLNVYARSAGPGSYVTTFGSSTQVRVTGTFSYITGYSSYLLAMTILLLAVLAATRWRFRGNLVVFAALGMTLLGMLMSGSRGPVFMLALLLPLYFWLGLAREGGAGRTLGQLLVVGGLLAVGLNYFGTEAVEAFYGRASGTSDFGSRLASPFVQPLHAFEEAGFLGYGIGATHQTAAAVTKDLPAYSWLHGVVLEGEPGQVMLELGPIGFALVYFVRLYLIFFALRQVFRLRTPFHRALATSALLFFLAHLPGAVVFNVTSGVYFWFFAGLLTLVLRLDRAPVAVPATVPPPAAPAAVSAPTRRRPRPAQAPDPARPAWPLPP